MSSTALHTAATTDTPVGTAAPETGGVVPDGATSPADAQLVEDEVIVEEISIDGMCGVY